MKKIENCIAMSIISLSLMNVYSANAGTVKVINENKKDLELNIKAQGAMTEKLSSYIQNIPAESQYSFTVQPENLKGKSTYLITGKTNPFLGDSCKNLSVDKDYQLTFTNDTLGTTCIAQEINN
jgi:hypothetical protein